MGKTGYSRNFRQSLCIKIYPNNSHCFASPKFSKKLAFYRYFFLDKLKIRAKIMNSHRIIRRTCICGLYSGKEALCHESHKAPKLPALMDL